MTRLQAHCEAPFLWSRVIFAKSELYFGSVFSIRWKNISVLVEFTTPKKGARLLRTPAGLAFFDCSLGIRNIAPAKHLCAAWLFQIFVVVEVVLYLLLPYF